MLNLFYQNYTLKDTLIVNLSNESADSITTNGDVTIGKTKDKVVFINLTNASKVFPKLVEGLLFPEKEIITKLSKLVNVDLTQYFDNGFKVGEIEACEEIKGTHLHKCVVNVGSAKLNIICGAPNAKQGLKVVVATNGTALPSGKLIIAGKLLGNQSDGMLCSYRELMIEKESKGIIELGKEFKVGDYFDEVYANRKKK